MSKMISREEFLSKKRDFSQLLVHLTRDDEMCNAKEVLDTILSEQELKAYNHYCLFSPSLKEKECDSLIDEFKVVCFTETPIDQIGVLLERVEGKTTKFDPYGLVFKKKYIRDKGGNPVFYTTKPTAHSLWQLYWSLYDRDIDNSSREICKLLSLVTLCDDEVDFHWEREWRIVGNLAFKVTDIYCGLCLDDDINYFEERYRPVTFISPYWKIDRILDKLVGKSKS